MAKVCYVCKREIAEGQAEQHLGGDIYRHQDCDPVEGPGAKARKKEEAMKARKAKAEARKREKREKKASNPKAERKPRAKGLLAHAADVLSGRKTPMNVKDLYAAVIEKGLWTPPNEGLTPTATLYAAIIREIAVKGEQSRFARGDVRGTFRHA